MNNDIYETPHDDWNGDEERMTEAELEILAILRNYRVSISMTKGLFDKIIQDLIWENPVTLEWKLSEQ